MIGIENILFTLVLRTQGSPYEGWFSGFGPSISLGDSPANTVVQYLNGALVFITLLAVAFLIYGGVLYITAGGDESKLKKAQATVTYTIIGLVVAFLAGFIVRFVLKQMGVSQPNNSPNLGNYDRDMGP